MAKLTQPPAVAVGSPAAPTPVPMPFTVASPTDTKKLRSPKTPASPKTEVLRHAAWFDKNFSAKAVDVLQRRRYPKRGGFRCASCGIPGAIAYVILGKDGQGEPLQIFDSTGKVSQTVNGFQVGKDCLRIYGHVDVTKLEAPAPPPPA